MKEPRNRINLPSEAPPVVSISTTNLDSHPELRKKNERSNKTGAVSTKQTTFSTAAK